MRRLLLMFACFLGTLAEGKEPQAAPFYASVVEWNYPQLPKLIGWRESDTLIATVLSENYRATRLSGECNAAGFSGWLESIHAAQSTHPTFTLIYLAAHQSPSGQWVFTDGTFLDWDQLLPSPQHLQHPTIVMLDCCYACSADLHPNFRSNLAPDLVIYASTATEVTPDLYVYHRTPVDWTRRCPLALAWLHQHHFGGSDERLSYLGLLWLEAFLRQPHPPQNLADWQVLASTLTTLSATISKDAVLHSTSTIQSR